MLDRLLNCRITGQECRNRRNVEAPCPRRPHINGHCIWNDTPRCRSSLYVDVKNNMNLIGSPAIKMRAHITSRLCVSLVCHNFSLFCLFLVLILHIVDHFKSVQLRHRFQLLCLFCVGRRKCLQRNYKIQMQ